ncbi:hypothetical protein F4777DRAFT_360812 [Nemania sp. FL0916]|nr:hypothetical protein F4777DRAFT_360812 [Nemania sp. FL0916]
MSVPPQLIRVKRKATEDAPVSYLRVQETKRHRSSSFVYQRQDEEATFAENIPVQIQKPVIHISQVPVSQVTTCQSITNQKTSPGKDPLDGKEDDDGNLSKSAAVPVDMDMNTADLHAEPRRFHMSRIDMSLAAFPYPGRSHRGVSKKRPTAAMFVERRARRVTSRLSEKTRAANDGPTATFPTADTSASESMDLDTPERRKFKKPSIAKLSAARDNGAENKPKLPISMTDRWNTDTQQLAVDMEAWAMQQLGLSLQKIEDETREQEKSKATTLSKLKFMPKAPAKRYAERHNKEAQQIVDKEMADADANAGHSDSDESDYIIETYVRVPATRIGAHVPPQSVGLLVFDAEPDVEFFYGGDDDSDDEWAEDEEDENAENYYTADYPDEEVATDDEFGNNPYAFRNDNASDLEEYDIGDESEDQSDDDDDDEDTTSQFRTYIGRNGLRSNHL